MRIRQRGQPSTRARRITSVPPVARRSSKNNQKSTSKPEQHYFESAAAAVLALSAKLKQRETPLPGKHAVHAGGQFIFGVVDTQNGSLYYSVTGKANMRYGYKIAPLVLLALYTFCSLCPGRFLPSMGSRQTVAESEPHEDCNKSDKRAVDYKCRELVSQYLPSETIKLSHDLAAQSFLMPSPDVSLAPDVLLLPRTTRLSNADPPIALLKTKLRI
jgi:hypothetical protein